MNLLSGFELLVDSVHLDVPSSAQRVIAYLALRVRPQPRGSVASALWLDVTEDRAAANLRSALWKLREVRERVVTARANHLSLATQVVVDVRAVVREARTLLDARRSRAEICDEGFEAFQWSGDLDLLSQDLLPDWDEDWILLERERFRQLRIHAIEALSTGLRLSGCYAEAVEAGLSAVAADPLRESAQRVLIQAHLAEGNIADGRRQFEAFKRLLWDDLGVPPSPELCALFESASRRDGRRHR